MHRVRLQAFVTGVVVLWLARFNIRNPWPRNPDEADLLVAARRAAQSMVPYERFTTTSYGPLWPMLLGTLHHLGLPLTMTGAHLVAAVLMAGVMCGFHVLLSRIIGRWPSFLAVLSMGIVWASGGMPFHADYQSLATEIGPLSVMVLGFVLLSTDRLTNLRICSAFACFGAMPLLKYQFGYMALAAATVALAAAWRRVPKLTLGRLVLWGGSMALPLILVVAGAMLGGNGPRLIDEAATVIGSHFNNERTPLSSRLSGTVSMLLGHPFFLLPLLFAATTIAVIPVRRDKTLLFPVGLGLALVPAVPSLVVLPTLFIHYSYLVLASSLLAVAWAGVALHDRLHHVRVATRGFAATVAVAALVLSLAYSHAPLNDPLRTQLAGPWSGVFSERALDFTADGSGIDPLADACPPDSKVFVWGWAAEMYAYYDWEPVSRYTIATWFTSGTNDKSVLRRRLADELARERPHCVVEAIGDGFFGGFSPETTLAATVPDTKDFLVRNYEAVSIEYLGNANRPRMTIHIASDDAGESRPTSDTGGGTGASQASD